jgi:hypothetical protein
LLPRRKIKIGIFSSAAITDSISHPCYHDFAASYFRCKYTSHMNMWKSCGTHSTVLGDAQIHALTARQLRPTRQFYEASCQYLEMIIAYTKVMLYIMILA